jgi:hypothetical protein
MGGSSSKTTKSITLDVVNEVITSNVLNASSKCEGDSGIDQLQKFDNICNDVDDEFALKMASAPGCLLALEMGKEVAMVAIKQGASAVKAMEQMSDGAAPFCKPCAIMGITQDGDIKNEVKCKLSNDMISKMLSEMDNKMKQSVSEKSDALTAASEGMADAVGGVFGSNKEEDISYSNSFKNRIEDSLTMDLVNEAIGRAKIIQKQQFNAVKHSFIKNISQKGTLDSMTEALMENKSYKETVSKMANDIDSSFSSDKTNAGLIKAAGEIAVAMTPAGATAQAVAAGLQAIPALIHGPDNGGDYDTDQYQEFPEDGGGGGGGGGGGVVGVAGVGVKQPESGSAQFLKFIVIIAIIGAFVWYFAFKDKMEE